MYQALLGMKFKDRRELCEFLGEDYVKGNSGKAQKKRLDRYFKCESTFGRSFKVTEVYDVPLPIVDGRGKTEGSRGNNSKYVVYIDDIFLSYISSLTVGEVNFCSNRVMLSHLGIVRKILRNDQKNSVEKAIGEANYRRFKELFPQIESEIVRVVLGFFSRSFDRMKEKGLIEGRQGLIMSREYCDENSEEDILSCVLNDKEYRLVTENEMDEVEALKKIICDEMALDSKGLSSAESVKNHSFVLSDNSRRKSLYSKLYRKAAPKFGYDYMYSGFKFKKVCNSFESKLNVEAQLIELKELVVENIYSKHWSKYGDPIVTLIMDILFDMIDVNELEYEDVLNRHIANDERYLEGDGAAEAMIDELIMSM